MSAGFSGTKGQQPYKKTEHELFRKTQYPQNLCNDFYGCCFAFSDDFTGFRHGRNKTVRVGYYENEVFQEGAREGLVKTGYAYEYYRKLSEYTGWDYQYVYGEFGELYQMLLDGEIDLLAGLAWREERAAIIGYPKAVMGRESYYLIKHDTDGNPENPAGINNCGRDRKTPDRR